MQLVTEARNKLRYMTKVMLNSIKICKFSMSNKISKIPYSQRDLIQSVFSMPYSHTELAQFSLHCHIT